MKKLLAMSMIGMIAITSISCSNDSMESNKDVQKTAITKQASKSGKDITKEEQAAIDAIKMDEAGRLPGGGAIIRCHTNYLAPTGHSCVSSGGYMVQVSWITTPQSGGGDIGPITYYFTDIVSECGC